MTNEELDSLISQLGEEGVVEEGASSQTRGIPSMLRQLSEVNHLSYSGKERHQLVELAGRIEQIAAQWHTDYPPLFAVTGLKNAGKSSLVKGFLSDTGRSRTPTGLQSDFATRRYVFWVPQAWQGDGDVSPFELMLRQVFGHDAERLSADPEIASQQYRDDWGHKGLRRPLVAYDRNLDDWRIGIVDCPDIETGDGLDESRLTDAREMLEKASRLCAAFVVIGQYETLERSIFWQILRIVDEVGNHSEKILVINKCPPKPAAHFRHELLQLAIDNRFTMDSFDVYAGYNFTARGTERFAVSVTDGKLPDGCARGDEDPEQLDSLLPTFFVCEDAGPHPPEPIANSRLLYSRVQHLSGLCLKHQFQAQMATELVSAVTEARRVLLLAGERSEALVAKSYHEVTGVLLSAMTRRGVVKPIQTPKLVDRQIQLLIDEAPATIRMSMRAMKWTRSSLKAGVTFVRERIAGRTGRMIFEARERLRKDGTKIDASDVAKRLSECESFGRLVGDRKQAVMTEWVAHAFNQFGRDFDQDVECLRPLVKEHFREMTKWDLAKSHAWSVGSLVVLLVAAGAFPIDGGATLYGISLFEGLLVSAGVAVVELGQVPGRIADAEQPLVEGQLDFLASQLAALAGLPSYRLLSSSISVTHRNVCYKLPGLSIGEVKSKPIVTLFHVDEAFMDRLCKRLNCFLDLKGEA